jgi:hypothetical protein
MEHHCARLTQLLEIWKSFRAIGPLLFSFRRSNGAMVAIAALVCLLVAAAGVAAQDIPVSFQHGGEQAICCSPA